MRLLLYSLMQIDAVDAQAVLLMATVRLSQPSFTVTGTPGAYLDGIGGGAAAGPVGEAVRRLEWATRNSGGANRAHCALLNELQKV